MAYYFSIYDTVAQLKTSTERIEGQQFIFVQNHKGDTTFNPFDDMFCVDVDECQTFDIMDQNSASVLASLLDETQLYRMTLELMLDEALSISASITDQNDDFKNAIEHAFSDFDRPEPMIATTQDEVNESGGIVHSSLTHYSNEDLAKVYIRFLQQLESLPFYPTFSILEMIKLNRDCLLKQFQAIQKQDLLWMNLEKALCHLKPASQEIYNLQDEKKLKTTAQNRNSDQTFKTPLSHLVMSFLQLERQQLFRAEGLLWLHNHYKNLDFNWLEHEFAKLVILDYQKHPFMQAISEFENKEIDEVRDFIDKKSDLPNALLSKKPTDLWPVLQDFVKKTQSRQSIAEKINF